jgi:hypothetical protein
MPAFFRLSRRRLRPLAGFAASACALAMPICANAATSCPASQAFAAFGDTNTYTLSENGSLESGASSWRLTGGATVVNNADPLGLLTAFTKQQSSDTHSLALPTGSSAQTIVTCTKDLQPPLRFAVRNTGTPTSLLQVSALTGSILAPTATPIGTITATTTWTPSPPLSFLVPQGALGFQFTPIGSGGQWQIDDVLVDPFKMR